MTTNWQDIERESIRQRLEDCPILLSQATDLFSIEDLNQGRVLGRLFTIGIRAADGGLVTNSTARRVKEVVKQLITERNQ